MMMLECKVHYVCGTCLQIRATKNPSTLLACNCQQNLFPFSFPQSPAVSPTDLQPIWRQQHPHAVGMQPRFRPGLVNHPPFPQAMQVHPENCQILVEHRPYQGVWIFVDDSNIWIEAKKLVSRLKCFDTHEDHRVRIDVGKLTDAVTRGRTVVNRYLYGSEPPPIDTVWKRMSQQGWNVSRHRRDIFSGKEKQIDTQLVADVTEIACSTPQDRRTTIVLVTGDVNTIPAIEKVMNYPGWRVEVHMWEQAISSALKRFASKYPGKIEIYYLDKSLEQITFTSMDFNYHSKYLQTQARVYGVVVTMIPNAFQGKLLSKHWIQTIEKVAQWPFQYYWITKGQETDDLLVVFKKDKASGREFDLAKFLKGVRPDDTAQEMPGTNNSDSEDSSEDFKRSESSKSDQEDHRTVIPHAKKLQTFIQYDQEKSKLLDKAMFCRAGVYLLNDVLQSGGNLEEIESEQPNGDDSEFQLVHSTSRSQFKRAQLYSDPCPYKYNCKHGINCQSSHSAEHEAYFHKNSGCGNPYRKVKQCQRHEYGACDQSKEECEYAHGDEDAWCLKCQTDGHFTGSPHRQ